MEACLAHRDSRKPARTVTGQKAMAGGPGLTRDLSCAQMQILAKHPRAVFYQNFKDKSSPLIQAAGKAQASEAVPHAPGAAIGISTHRSCLGIGIA